LSESLSPQQQLLLAELHQYCPADSTEEQHRLDMIELVNAHQAWWHRDTLPGHITASAFVVSPDLQSLLLHFHRKLDRWLQFGGHDEGEQHPAKAVLRELVEESGLQQFDFFGEPAFFDLDIHAIPESPKMAAHLHYDVRFLFVADAKQTLSPADGESDLLRWMSLKDAAEALDEEASQRVYRKLLDLQQAKR
jgi:ADP-ribose pyrophosphatase YjhB (NUDIX family)